MHLPKPALLVSLFVAVAHAEIDSICGSLSTVFVTISGPPVTKTVTVPFETPSTIISNNVVPINSSISSGSSINITTKLTEYITILRTVTTSHAISKSVGANQGRYTFTESDGSTFWFGGKTPPAGVPLVTSTATITIQPTPPSSGVSTRGTEENTSYTTVFLTVVSRKYEVLSLTKTAIASTTAVVPSIAPTTSTISTRLTVTAPLTATVSSVPTIFQKLFSGNRSNGWNNTLTIGLKEKVADVGTEPVKPSPQQSSAKEYHDARPGIASLAGTYANATKDLEARQLGSIVVATINGVVVSWTNNYDGAAAVTPAPVSVESNAPSRKAIVTPTPERIEVPIYPWDLQPIPIQVFPIISPEPTVVSSVQQLPTRSSVPHHQHSTSTDFQETLVVTLSSVQQTEPATSSARSLTSSLIKTRTLTKQLSLASISHKHPISNLSKLPSAVQTKIVTSVKPIRSSHKASSTKTSTLGGVDSITTHTATSATPSSCAGNKAEFIIDFDDLPHFSTGPDDVDIPPIFSPYRKLFFEDHYGYVPPPSDPFPPISPPQLAVYRASPGTKANGPPDVDLESAGEFGAGPRASESAYWIDAFSVWLGCANGGPSDCILTIDGYRNGSSTRVVSQTVTQTPCPGLVNCQLSLVEFTDDFRNLSGIQVLAAVNLKPTVYYMDDLSLRWSNNSCAAQRKRALSR